MVYQSWRGRRTELVVLKRTRKRLGRKVDRSQSSKQWQRHVRAEDAVQLMNIACQLHVTRALVTAELTSCSSYRSAID